MVGKKFQSTTKIKYIIQTLEQFNQTYGARAKQAQTNSNIDWKALSHALRAAYQTEEILTHNNITFPLPKAPYLTKVKQGLIPYPKVEKHLEEKMEKIETLSKNSNLPTNPDTPFWNNFIMETLTKEYLE